MGGKLLLHIRDLSSASFPTHISTHTHTHTTYYINCTLVIYMQRLEECWEHFEAKCISLVHFKIKITGWSTGMQCGIFTKVLHNSVKLPVVCPSVCVWQCLFPPPACEVPIDECKWELTLNKYFFSSAAGPAEVPMMSPNGSIPPIHVPPGYISQVGLGF